MIQYYEDDRNYKLFYYFPFNPNCIFTGCKQKYLNLRNFSIIFKKQLIYKINL